MHVFLGITTKPLTEVYKTFRVCTSLTRDGFKHVGGGKKFYFFFFSSQNWSLVRVFQGNNTNKTCKKYSAMNSS